MRTKIWNKIKWYILIVLLITATVSALFWLWFGKDLTVRFTYLEVDFFNTVCGILTIIGLIIALYQISEIKTEEEIVEKTIAATHKKAFTDESISKFAILKSQLQELQSRMANDIYSAEVIKNYSEIFTKVIEEIKETNIRQKILSNPIIVCDNFVPLLEALLNECDRMIAKREYGKFKKTFFRTKLSKIIELISECEQQLKN
jgi:hypothetical protein